MNKVFALFAVTVVSMTTAMSNSMPPAKPQLLEGLLFGAISGGANALLANSQKSVTSTVKVVFDVYYIGGGSPRYMCSWDPTTQTSVWFGDQVGLRVKAYSNGVPRGDQTVYANDKLVEWRDVEAGRVRNGKPNNAKGVIGGYPIILVRDLDMGFNQIKVRYSDREWGSATFIRLDIREFFSLAQNEEARLAIAGAGQSTYPVLQSYTAKMPDGQIRNFTSVEEFQIALKAASGGQQNQDPQYRNDPVQPERVVNPPSIEPRGTIEREEPLFCSVTVGAFQTPSTKALDFQIQTDVERKLLNESRKNIFEPNVTEIRLLVGHQTLIRLSDRERFKAEVRFIDRDDATINLDVIQKDGNWQAYTWARNANLVNREIIVTDGIGRKRQIRFVYESNEN